MGAKLGHIVSEDTKNKIRNTCKRKGIKPPTEKGDKFTVEHKLNLSKSHIGQVAWNKGKPHLKIRGENHPKW